jgi:hypothetical protein
MIDQSKTKVVGAFVIGFAIIAGAFVLRSFGQPATPPPTSQAATAELTNRQVIEVVDTDTNGIEDWQEQFVKSSPILMGGDGAEYEAPDTLTGQVGIAFIQSVITSKGYGGVGRSKEQVIADTVEQVSTFANDKIFVLKDLTVSNDSSPEALRLYANAHADAIVGNSVPDLRHELLILRDVLNGTNEKGIDELKTLAQVYLGTRDDVLKLAVPPLLVKEHMDLINVYHAMYKDIDSMTAAVNDPMLSLVRLKRYEDDAKGLGLALQNMYKALEPYASAFNKDDSAILFVAFSPNLQ